MVDEIEARGGRVFVRAAVKSIQVKSGKTVGVLLKKANFMIHSDCVVTAVGALTTIENGLEWGIGARGGGLLEACSTLQHTTGRPARHIVAAPSGFLRPAQRSALYASAGAVWAWGG